MKAAYIIAEYNPFHNGHLFQIDWTRQALHPDVVACIMSGNFTQRGSPAIVDKWARTKMALESGADLVVELHPVYAMASADYFAMGAVGTAAQFGVPGWLSFGAEAGPEAMELLSEIGKLLATEPEPFKSRLAFYLGQGFSFARARASAAADCYTAQHTVRGETYKRQVIDLLTRPNNILAIEYLKALHRIQTTIQPYVIKRIGGDDRAEAVSGSYVGAAAIRQVLEHATSGLPQELAEIMPASACRVLAEEMAQSRGPVFQSDYFLQLTTILRRMDTEQIRRYPDVTEGLENRIAAEARTAGDFEMLVDAVSSKRYPKARIRRILSAILLGFDNGTLERLSAKAGPPYIRVLGFNSAGRQMLSYAKETSAVPVITRFAALKKSDCPRTKAFVQLEARATDIYITAFREQRERCGGSDFLRGPVIMP